jgi:hypothetical protein
VNQSLLGELNAVMPAAEQTGLFSSLVTFRDITGATNSSGQVDLSTLVDVPGLVNIPCQLSAAMLLRPDASGGGRMPDHFYEKSIRHLLLNDYYPAIQQRFIAVVDGTQYEIIPGAVEPTSQRQQTRLSIRTYQL